MYIHKKMINKYNQLNYINKYLLNIKYTDEQNID